jgi:hypothetical protein
MWSYLQQESLQLRTIARVNVFRHGNGARAMLAEKVRNIESLEDLFALFKLDFDRHTVNVHRLHILRVFGQIVEEVESRAPPPTEEERGILYASALLQAHDRYALNECSCEPPVFPGLARAFVPLRLRR